MAYLLVPRYPNTSCFKTGSTEEIAASCSAILTHYFNVVVGSCHADVYRFLLVEEEAASRSQRVWAINQVRRLVMAPQLEQYWRQLVDSQRQVCSDRSLFGRLSDESKRVLKHTFVYETMSYNDRMAVVQALVEARGLLRQDAAKARERRAAGRPDDGEFILPSGPAGGKGTPADQRAKRAARAARDREETRRRKGDTAAKPLR